MIRPGTFVFVCVLVALAVTAVEATRETTPPAPAAPRPSATEQDSAVAADAAQGPHVLPDPRFTPGATNPDVTQDNVDSTICVPGYTKTIRPPARYTSHLKREQLDDPARGYNDDSMRDFEEDHLVPLEVGGNPTDPRNLWPEPLHGPWNAHLKDRLENRVHELVCAHEITLEQGQMVFERDWIAGFRQYLG